MKRRASGEIIENEVTLSEPKETGQSGWGESQASLPEGNIIDSKITEQLLADLQPGYPQDDIHPNSDVNLVDYYHNVDPFIYPNDANIQEWRLGDYAVQQTCEEGGQRVSEYRHTFQATASQAFNTTLFAPTLDAANFYSPQVPHVRHMPDNFADGSTNYQPGPVFSPQMTGYQDGGSHFSYGELLNSDGAFMIPEDTPVSDATPASEATPVPKVIHTAKPPKTQKRRKRKEGRAPPAANVNDNGNNPAPATREGHWCLWLGCKHKGPFSKMHNLIQHRRVVHKEDIPILRYRFGRPPPNDPSRRMQQHGRRGVETATGEK